MATRVLAVDQPGHGRSGGPPLPDVEALADWMLALLAPPGSSAPRWSATAWAR